MQASVLILLAICGLAIAGDFGELPRSATSARTSQYEGVAGIPFSRRWLRNLQQQDAACERITGGCSCPVDRFPYMVSLRNRVTEIHECGGILINKFWILTAAHCVTSNSNSLVIAGSRFLNGGENREELIVTETIVHEKYAGEPSGGYDIALLKLRAPTTEVTIFANLPSSSTVYNPGHALIAIGWGRNGNELENELQCSRDLKVVGLGRCGELWKNQSLQPSMLCAFNEVSDTCQGDSGGPLLDANAPLRDLSQGQPTKDVVAAITSFGPLCREKREIPGVYTFLAPFRQWIDKKIGEGSPQPPTPPSSPPPPPPLSPPPSSPPPLSPPPSSPPSPPSPPVSPPPPPPPPPSSPPPSSPPLPPENEPSSLVEAASEGDLELVRSEFEKGVDIEVQGSNGETALIAAAANGHAEIVAFLLDNGADIEARDDSGFTAMISAVLADELDIVVLLLERGADVEARSNFGSSSLLLASFDGFSGIVKVLVEEGADTEARNDEGVTPLLLAAQEGKLEVVVLLLNNGANIEAINDDGDFTALIIAAQEGQLDVVEELISRGANITAVNNDGVTSLHRAAQSSGGGSMISALLAAGADINAKSVTGSTPLHFAASSGQRSNMQLLLREGADKTAVNDFGDMPIDDVCDCLTTMVPCNRNICTRSKQELVDLLE